MDYKDLVNNLGNTETDPVIANGFITSARMLYALDFADTITDTDYDFIYSEIKQKVYITLPNGMYAGFLCYQDNVVDFVTKRFPEIPVYVVCDAENTEQITKFKNMKSSLPSIKLIYKEKNPEQYVYSKSSVIILLNKEKNEIYSSPLTTDTKQSFTLMTPSATESKTIGFSTVPVERGGWNYNPTSGIWTKAIGWDLTMTMQGW